MSQQEIKSWVLVSSVNKETNTQDIEKISPEISKLVEDWHSEGKKMMSGIFNHDSSYMAIFEATEKEANEFYKKYENVCSGSFSYEMYEWDAMPMLSGMQNH